MYIHIHVCKPVICKKNSTCISYVAKNMSRNQSNRDTIHFFSFLSAKPLVWGSPNLRKPQNWGMVINSLRICIPFYTQNKDYHGLPLFHDLNCSLPLFFNPQFMVIKSCRHSIDIPFFHRFGTWGCSSANNWVAYGSKNTPW